MKLFIISCLVACAVADVSHLDKTDESHANIISQELEVSPEGSYRFGFLSDNGITVEAKGDIINPDGETPSQEVQGLVQYTAPNGEPIAFQYIANENGYQPQGSHLPTPPPIPEAILRALEYIRAHLPQTVNQI